MNSTLAKKILFVVANNKCPRGFFIFNLPLPRTTRARHAGDGGGDQARYLSTADSPRLDGGVSGSPSRL